MKIRMKETVEDSHGYYEIVDGGKQVQRWHVCKLLKGKVYDGTGMPPGWGRRAEKLVGMGLAEVVK